MDLDDEEMARQLQKAMGSRSASSKRLTELQSPSPQRGGRTVSMERIHVVDSSHSTPNPYGSLLLQQQSRPPRGGQVRAPYGARLQYPPQYPTQAPRFRDPAPSYPSQYNALSPSNPQSRYVPKQPRVNPEQLRYPKHIRTPRPQDNRDMPHAETPAPPKSSLPPALGLSLSDTIETFFDSQVCSEEDLKARAIALQDVENSARQLHSKARVYAFGSSGSGFATKTSDIDMCLIINEDEFMQDNPKLRASLEVGNAVVSLLSAVPSLREDYTDAAATLPHREGKETSQTQLVKLCSKHGLPTPRYKIETKNEGTKHQLSAIVSVGDYSFTGLPRWTESDANETAAYGALVKLRKTIQKPESLSALKQQASGAIVAQPLAVHLQSSSPATKSPTIPELLQQYCEKHCLPKPQYEEKVDDQVKGFRFDVLIGESVYHGPNVMSRPAARKKAAAHALNMLERGTPSKPSSEPTEADLRKQLEQLCQEANWPQPKTINEQDQAGLLMNTFCVVTMGDVTVKGLHSPSMAIATISAYQKAIEKVESAIVQQRQATQGSSASTCEQSTSVGEQSKSAQTVNQVAEEALMSDRRVEELSMESLAVQPPPSST